MSRKFSIFSVMFITPFPLLFTKHFIFNCHHCDPTSMKESSLFSLHIFHARDWMHWGSGTFANGTFVDGRVGSESRSSKSWSDTPSCLILEGRLTNKPTNPIGHRATVSPWRVQDAHFKDANAKPREWSWLFLGHPLSYQLEAELERELISEPLWPSHLVSAL